MTSNLTEIPNIGPAIARKLERLDVAALDDLRGRDPHELFERLCALDGRRHDPCLLPRFVPMGEAMMALVLADHWLRQQASRVTVGA